MMGGVHTDIDGATPLAGPVRRGRDRLREHQRRQPARLQLAARVPGLRRPRRAGGRRVRRQRRADRRPRSRPRPPTRCAGSSATARHGAPAASAIADHPRPRCSTTMEDGAGIYRTGRRRWPRARTSSRRAAGAVRRASASRTPAARFNTELVAALELANMLDVAESMLALGAAARGVARRPPAHRLPGPRRRAVPRPPRWSHRDPDGTPRVEYLPVTITRWPPGERVYGR